MKLPLARNKNLVSQNLEKEILIYDLTSHKAYCLNETAAAVYRACDGVTTFSELKTRNDFSIDLIFLTLDQLREKHLVENFESPFAGVSRREVIRKVGLTTMIALPVIAGMVAPTAAHAASSSCPGGTNTGDPGGYQGAGGTCLCSSGTATCGRGNTGNPSNSCRTNCTCTTDGSTIIIGGTTFYFGTCG